MPYADVEVAMRRSTFPSESRGRAGARGFTLIELLIVVGIIGMVSAMAVVGYRKYLNSAQTSEARVVMGMIRAGEESYRQDTNTYLTCSATLSSYYPNPSPNDTRWAWEQPGNLNYSGCWQMLGVHPDAPVRFGYAVMNGVAPTIPGGLDGAFQYPPAWPTNLTTGTPWYVVAAKNQRPGSALPSLAVTSSWDDKVYMEGEGL